MSNELTHNPGQFDEVIHIIDNARSRAMKAVNAELIQMYWSVGAYLSELCSASSFGDKIIDEVAAYIAQENPNIKGFNRRGLYRMKQFYETYKDDEFVTPLVTQISWTNHLLIMSGSKTADERHFYMALCAKEHYSKRELERQIGTSYYERSMISAKKPMPESVSHDVRESILDTYAERNNMTIVGTYIDRALSAKTADRPEFQHMIKDSAKELFEIVLVWKLDRFSRDRYDSAHYKHILKKNGVKVVSAKEHISEGPEGIILEAMLEGYAEFYSAELSEKIHRGQKENALKGKNNGGGVPLGYLLDKKAQKLAIDPTTAPLVVEVFEKYADGKSVRSIVEDFNARGLKTKRGQPFNINSFSSLLKNRKYIGEYRYQDVAIEGGVPAIVPEDLFNRVQERMEKNRHAPAMAKAKEDYLLTTKLFCGKCERMMVGESGKSHTGAMHYYYKCSGAKRLKDCDKKAVRKDWIERVVVRLTMQRVMDEEKINRLIDAILVMQEQEDTTTPALCSQLAETESSIGNILKAIEQGIFTPSTKQRLDELEARKEEILVNIQTAELQKPKLNREQMTAWFEQFRHGDPTNREFQKRLIDTFVNAVYVFDDKLVLTYNYQHGAQTISLEEIESALSSDFDGDTPP